MAQGADLPTELQFDVTDPNEPKPRPPVAPGPLPVDIFAPAPAGVKPLSAPKPTSAPVATQAPLAAATPAKPIEPTQPQPTPQAPQIGQLPDLTSLFDKLNEPPDPNAASAEEALSKKILEYIDTLGEKPAPHLPMTTGETIALGLLGGLDANAFQQVVLPLLAHERDLPRQALQDRQHQIGLQLQALESLARLREAQAEKREGRAFKEADLRLRVEEMRKGVEQFNVGQRGALQREQLSQAGALQREQARAEAQKEMVGLKVPPMVEANHNAILHALDRAREAAKIIDDEVRAGGETPGGPFAGRFLSKWTPGGETRAHLAALFAPINDSILKFYQRRGLSGEALEKINSALPDIRMQGAELEAAISQSIVTLNRLVQLDEAEHPSLRNLPGALTPMGAQPSAAPILPGDEPLDYDVDVE